MKDKATIADYITGEWMLKNKANSGGIVFWRSLQISLSILLPIMLFQNIFDPTRTYQPDFSEFLKQFSEKLPWLGAIFVAVYAGLYARFSSQWTYLANLYNSIKQTEASCKDNLNQTKLAEWKDGFMEDAVLLHLANKDIFKSVIDEWEKDPEVKKVRNNDSNSSNESA